MHARTLVLSGVVTLAATTPGYASGCELERKTAPAPVMGTRIPELVDAAAAGDTARIQEFLKHGADVNSAGKNGTALMAAASKGQAAAVELLLANGADQSLSNSDQETALHLAAKAGRDEVIKILLAYGGDVNIETQGLQYWIRGKTPLHFAVADHPGTVNLLIDCGAAINARDGFGDTALHYAVRNVASDMVLLLLERGANPTVRNHAGKLPLQVRGKDCIAKETALTLIANGFTLKPDLNTALFAAIEYPPTLACVPFVEALLDQGADVNDRTTIGLTPLTRAVWGRDLPMVTVLLGRGADPYLPDKDGRTTFDYGTTREIKAMLESVPRKAADESP